MNLKPPFSRQGNKYNIKNKIISYIPEHKIYVELFAGSASIFFNKELAEINILNDIDKDVYTRLQLLKKAPLEKDKYKKLKTLKSKTNFINNHSDSIEDLLLYHRIKSNNGFYSIPIIDKAYKNPYYGYFLEHLENYKNMLKKAIITNNDYETILKKYDSDNTFFL